MNVSREPSSVQIRSSEEGNAAWMAKAVDGVIDEGLGNVEGGFLVVV